MTRRAGFLTIRLHHSRALRLAQAIAGLRLEEPTALGAAGHEVEAAAGVEAQRELLGVLSKELLPSATGRPRGAVATYSLPRAAIQLLDTQNVRYQLPRGTLVLIERLLEKSARRGRGRMPRYYRQLDMKGDHLSPETKRHYRWQETTQAPAFAAAQARKRQRVRKQELPTLAYMLGVLMRQK